MELLIIAYVFDYFTKILNSHQRAYIYITEF